MVWGDFEPIGMDSSVGVIFPSELRSLRTSVLSSGLSLRKEQQLFLQGLDPKNFSLSPEERAAAPSSNSGTL